MPVSPTTRCDCCGRAMDKAHAHHAGMAFCATCYAREFKRVKCSECGRGMRSYHGEEPATCKSCRTKGRTCGGCGKPLPKASRITPEGDALCWPCAAKRNEPKPCALCGQLSLTLSRMPSEGIDVPICHHCRSKRTHFTCTACGKYRKPAGLDKAGRVVCKTCLEQADWVCPSCGKPGKRHSSRRCVECYWSDHAKEATKAGVGVLPRPWTKKAYGHFGRVLVETYGARKASHRVKKYLPFFIALDARFRENSRITVRELVLGFGMEGLRRNGVAVSFLIREGYLPKASQWELEHYNDIQRQERLIDESSGTWYHGLLERFRQDALERQRKALDRRRAGPKSSTIYSWLQAAKRFAEFLDENGVTATTQIDKTHLDGFLYACPGYMNSIPRFVRYLAKNEKLFRALKMPSRTAQANNWIVLPDAEFAQLLVRFLDEDTDAKEACLGVLMLLYCQSSTAVVRLRTERLARTADGRMSLKFSRMPVALDPDVEVVVQRYLAQRAALSVLESADDNPYLFPGRRLGSHMSSGSVAYYLDRWGVHSEQLVATGLYRLYQNGMIHPNVPAHAFGLSKAVTGKYLALFDSRQNAVISGHVQTQVAIQAGSGSQP